MTQEQLSDAILFEKIDCNCNNCIHMIRDSELFKKWEKWNRELQEAQFDKSKQKAILDAKESISKADTLENKRSCEGILRKAEKMSFTFSREGLIHYGNCNKLNKAVSFIPGMCQIDTQECFSHRRG